MSSGNAKNVIKQWNTKSERIGTAFVIDREEIIHQAFSSAFWAHHLGPVEINKTILNNQSIGIELCSWGLLTKKNDKYYNAYSQEIPSEEVIIYQKLFRGSFYYQKYTDKQLDSLRNLVVYLFDAYGIPKTYNLGL